MKREFLINIFLLFIVNLMVKPLYIFGIEAKVQDIAGTASYGLYFFYFNFIFLFQAINDPGLQSWNAQYLPKNKEHGNYLIPEIIQAKMLLGVIFLVIVNILFYLLGYTDIQMIFFISINFVLSSAFMLMRGMISGMGFYRIDSLISALDKLLLILILGYILYFSGLKRDFNMMWFIKIQTFVYIFLCIGGLLTLISKTTLIPRLLRTERFVAILKSGLPYLLIMIYMTLYNKLDGVMLGWLLDDNKFQAGLYAAAFRFYEAANMSGYLFASILLPMFAAHITQKSIVTELIAIGTKLTLAIGFVMIACIFFYGDQILKLLYSDYKPELFLILKILIIAYCLVSIAYIYGTYITSTGSVKRLNVVYAGGLLINIALCLVFIPEFGAVGAAISTLCTQAFVMIGQLYLVNSQLKMTIKPDEITGIILFAFSVFVLFGIMIYLSAFPWISNLIVSILICLPLVFIFKIIEKREILMIFKRN